MGSSDARELLKGHVTAFCHRNMTTFTHDMEKGLWVVMADSFPVSVQLSKDGMIVTVFSRVSGVLKISRDVEHALFEKLLRINLTLIGPSFSISPSGEIFLTYSRSVEDLDYNELAHLIVAAKTTARRYAELIGRVTELTTPSRSGGGERQSLLSNGNDLRGSYLDLTLERRERENELSQCMENGDSLSQDDNDIQDDHGVQIENEIQVQNDIQCESSEIALNDDDNSAKSSNGSATPESAQITASDVKTLTEPDFDSEWDFAPLDAPVNSGESVSAFSDENFESDDESSKNNQDNDNKPSSGDEWDFGV
ncbi:MAG: hypothetical protein CVV64_04475 [Candidatus Wallbacteria bacterium HGW-Wallbacteria-1]|jgi:hypothetical protein|uniref:Uncharacterized protein n=1 Tax=Candidatus Wallbacteria bacterium HGW-Wallbacteria-1 TaxID=2013854 RepID=A0A2N1PRY4_9BACT|nr:MAG: hypothetical protein CVV64_04475 [Candidatus Wallbacteria bacterium HGW-Wallbacteria-1]